MLKKYFGFDTFRSGQEEVISSVLNCNDTLAVMPTGGGKSICYQLPAMIMPGTVLVVSPLIALMKDQVDTLISGNIRATSINSTLPYDEINNRLARASEGYYKLVYVAPERLVNKYFLSLLQNMNISFIAIDEAHCISEWGHDFRPSYQNINKIFDFIPRCPVLALTATATMEVQDDIVSSLKMNNPKKFVKGFDRTNLSYHTEKVYDKVERISEIVSGISDGSTIIYAGSRKRVEYFAEELRKSGIKAESYHAGMKVLLRNAVQERFISGKIKVIVATNAFGMGIDKSDVRNVIHVDYPLTIEAYYQEAGRAGRDGKHSDCWLLYNESDKDLPEFFIKSTYPVKKDVDKVLSEISSGFTNASAAESENYNIPDPLNLANKLSMDFRTVKSIFGLLERNEVIARGYYHNSSEIFIGTSKDRIHEYYANSSDERKAALEALLRSVNPDVFSRKVSLNIKDIIVKQSIPKSDFDELIKSMQMLGMVSYFSKSSEESYFLNNFIHSSDEINIDFEKIQKRCVHAIKKLDQVIRYGLTNDCKRNFILEYFNDDDFKGNCGRCSSCKSNKIKNTVNSSSNNYENFELYVLKFLVENKNSVKLSDIKVYFEENVLAGVSRKFPNILLNFKPDDFINNLLNSLNEKRLVEFQKANKSKIYITKAGEEFLKQLPEQSRTMARPEKVKTKSEMIFNKLVTLRREIAENAGVVPRGIISDVAMRKIAEVMPETEYDLKNVSGVSQLFVQKFAKIFLQELAKIKLNPKEQKVSKVAKDALRLLEQGEDFDKIKTRLFAGNSLMMANYVVEILEAGYDLPRKELVPDTIYRQVKACIKKNPDLGQRDLQSKLAIDIEPPIMKMAYAFAKNDLGIL
ncbi:MAG: RecQ family ATP-dependent DNA helicase [Candidatus Kapabacteria bacterium]|nr:RecQ family ATP-dependent DNA helicase [Ignavibacteriota bacterium]MCW5885292.1 RecQ family ATP-dependent DNA helicase [Candidatus Kapabacteria bacterium]